VLAQELERGQVHRAGGEPFADDGEFLAEACGEEIDDPRAIHLRMT
jgi:hypothetical protein